MMKIMTDDELEIHFNTRDNGETRTIIYQEAKRARAQELFYETNWLRQQMEKDKEHEKQVESLKCRAKYLEDQLKPAWSEG